MMSAAAKKPGRNEKCHCGSGKKYKHCHLDADRQSEAAARQTRPDSTGEPEAAELGNSPDLVERLPKLLERLSKQGSAKDRADFAKLEKAAKTTIEYKRRREEIERAAAARTRIGRNSSDSRRRKTSIWPGPTFCLRRNASPL
jgi:hypothetical protein